MNYCRLVYDRYFNADPSCLYKGKTVIGADVDLLFSFYDESGKEIFYKEGDDCIAQEELTASIDKQCGIKLSVKCHKGGNITVISAEPIKFYLDIYIGKAGDCLKDCPKEIRNEPVCKPMELSREEFIKFIRDNWACFNNTDNFEAQCTAMRYEPVNEPIEQAV